MTDAPIIINKSRSRRAESSFNLTAEDIPLTQSEGFRNYRLAAWKTYENLPYPTDKDEAWRRTSLRSLDKETIQFNKGNISSNLIPEKYKTPIIEGVHAGQMILHSGGAESKLDAKYADQGVILADLEDVVKNNPDLVLQTIGTLVKPSDGKFSALVSAFASHGMFLYVPNGVKIEEPLHTLIWAEGKNSGSFSHNVIWLEDNADVTVVLEYASQPESGHNQFHSGILEVFVGKDANLELVELQSWGVSMWNIMHEKVSVQQNGNLTWIFGSLGSHLTKSFSSVNLDGEGAAAKVSGFFFADADQHFDMDTEQNHNAPNTTSDLLYKGAITGNARSVWQGNIYVAPGANGTDGYQANRNLILSKHARADSIPGLEILADDVKCTHGATVGKVDPEQIFYLQSRGLSKNEAKHLIVEGFFETVMARIPFEEVQERFRNAIIEKIDTQS